MPIKPCLRRFQKEDMTGSFAASDRDSWFRVCARLSSSV